MPPGAETLLDALAGTGSGAAGEMRGTARPETGTHASAVATAAANARAAGTTRTAAVIVPDWALLAARDRHDRKQAASSGGDGTAPTSSTRPPAVPDGAGPSASSGDTAAVSEDPAPDGPDPRAPIILFERHRVVHADLAAQEAGVAIGMRRRAAQAACPDATVLETDRENESSLFELVAAAVDTVAAGVDVLRPGVLLMGAQGPARHAGGEAALAESILDAVAELTGWDCAVGIADGPFAALLAARAGRIVHPGRSADYLSPHPITALRHAPVGPGWGHRHQAAPAAREKSLDLSETVDLLQRLGITTLGDLAALPPAAVSDRFGPDIALLHLLARGLEPAPPAAHRPEQPIEVVRALETPLVRTDQAAFVARPMAEELQQLLRDRGLICTRLRILARTEAGEEMERTWRHDGALSVGDVVDRIRWQCDGWITSARLGTARTGAITRLGLHPVQLMPAGEGAAALWGSAGEATQRASRAFARAQGLAGEQAVLVPAATGGRLLGEEVRLVPWRSEKPARREGPWPGSLPRPVPATVFRHRPPVRLCTSTGEDVLVTARGLLTGPPLRLLVPREGTEVLRGTCLTPGTELPILSCGAPTVLDERWWTAAGHRAARLQLVVGEEGSGTALVVLSCEGIWSVEGIYD
ncbi:DNA polymerase Y family protein [Brachybacterium sp. AOP25-B2-12]|uniref:DNA polymerase Y family protein n=1 Tax=Brachybacterium sp. AOP25-B2-12 TaxID=3457710 RepID=UPI0040339113